MAGPDPARVGSPHSPANDPKARGKRFAADLPNERWQADLTHWQLADGTSVEIHHILDDHSRLAITSKARTTTTGPDVSDRLPSRIPPPRHPRSVLTDNGAVYTGTPRRGGRVALGSNSTSSASDSTTPGPTIHRPKAK
ncbi:MAG: DDE-type integrase/transposase/recombinase [Actinomycetales bacterium]|nr:DDE-type integrase/transposase/recombinase [Actinomycetales bacterium]